MYLSADDHLAAANARDRLSRVLASAPCEPFDVAPEEDDDNNKDDDNNDNNDDNDNDDTHGDKTDTDDATAHERPAPSFDTLFVYHSQFMTTCDTLRPTYTQYVKWAKAEQRVRKELVDHQNELLDEDPPGPVSRFDPFAAIQRQNKQDTRTKRTRQLQTEHKQLQGLQSRFLADVTEREATVRKWEEDVKAAWAQVLPQLVTHGVPLRRPALRTMEWLHTHRLLSGSYTDHVDVGHAVLTATLPYTGMVVGAGMAINAVYWSQLATTWRFYASMVALYRCYPWLRTWQTSSYRVRADVLTWSLLVWSMADESTAFAWWCGLELLVHWLEYIGVGTVG